jgi:predicted nucleotidyltransferase
LDILIELDRPPKISLIGLIELEDYLSQVLGVKVDLAIKTNLKKRIGRWILQEVVPI